MLVAQGGFSRFARCLLCLFLLIGSTLFCDAAVPAFSDFFGTNGILIRTNGNKVQVDGIGLTNGASSVFFITNLFVNNEFVSNIITTNISVNQTLITSNTFTTNLTVNNNAFISNIFVTNLTVQNITNLIEVTSNLFVTNINAVNEFVTNLTVQNLTNLTLVTSNLITTNLTVNNNEFVSNIFVTNIFLGGTLSSRVLTLPNNGFFDGTNEIFTTNLVSSLAVTMTNLSEGTHYFLIVSNPGQYSVTFPNLPPDSWTTHQDAAPNATTNGWTTYFFLRTGTHTNSLDFGQELVLTNGNNITIVTNGNQLVISSTGGTGSLTGTTNFMNLSVQAAKLPTTNFPGIDGGWPAWETVYYETNAEGSRADLNASWQFLVPPDYATNSLSLLINYSLLGTNGPNTSNVIWGASVAVFRSGTTNNVHTNYAAGFVAWGTNNWIAKYDGTNIVTNLVINLGTNSLLQPGDLSVLNLQRDALNDTYGGAVALHGLQVQYTRP